MDTVCNNCGSHNPQEKLNPIKNLHERVEAGEVVPAGECPMCGALCTRVIDTYIEKTLTVSTAHLEDVDMTKLQGLLEDFPSWAWDYPDGLAIVIPPKGGQCPYQDLQLTPLFWDFFNLAQSNGCHMLQFDNAADGLDGYKTVYDE